MVAWLLLVTLLAFLFLYAYVRSITERNKAMKEIDKREMMKIAREESRTQANGLRQEMLELVHSYLDTRECPVCKQVMPVVLFSEGHFQRNLFRCMGCLKVFRPGFIEEK